MGSSNVTSGAYQESTMGLKKEMYSWANTRFSLVMVLDSSSVCVDVGESVLVLDMQIVPPPWLRRFCTFDSDAGAGADGRELLNASPL